MIFVGQFLRWGTVQVASLFFMMSGDSAGRLSLGQEALKTVQSQVVDAGCQLST